MQAWIDGNASRCEELLAPGFRLRSVATDTIVDRDEWVRQVESGRVTGTSFEYQEMDVHVSGDTAVTMSRTRQSAKIAGRDWSATLNVTDVWVRGADDGRWRVVARHASPPVGRGGEMRS
jgi:hypothetical protein